MIDAIIADMRQFTREARPIGLKISLRNFYYWAAVRGSLGGGEAHTWHADQ